MLLDWIRTTGRRAFEAVEAGFSRAYGEAWNPLYHLGALAFFFFWIVALSGIYLYIFFETSIEGAYDSIEYLTVEQWYLGGVMRSLHRYASDAMVVAVALHLVREFLLDHYRGVRWFSWFSGVLLIGLLYASGIGGYWLVWDRLAQFIAVLTAEWLDWLPFFTEPMARNFLNQGSLSDRFFSLLAFLHIGIPLTLLLGMWVHIQRISQPRTNPPLGLGVGMLLALLVLSLLRPALSQPPANLDLEVTTVQLDWFFVFFYPLIDRWSPGAVWMTAGGISLLLLVLPWLPPLREVPVAVVDLNNCNGCGRCFADCPYSAITMAPRSDGLAFDTEAVVNPTLCVSCGICVGACPTAMPFRRATELIAGVEMPQLTVRALRADLLARCERLSGDGRVLIVGCDPGARLAGLDDDTTVALALPCVGMLPPAFLDFAITRGLVDGVLLTGCRGGSCYHRFGIDWTEARLARTRDPQLRQRVPTERVQTVWAGRGGSRALRAELDAFRTRLRAMPAYERPISREPVAPAPLAESAAQESQP